MKNLGGYISLAGFALVVYSFLMNTSVDVGDGTRVHNIGLLVRQQNLFILGCCLLVVGVMSQMLSSRKRRGNIRADKNTKVRNIDDLIVDVNGERYLNEEGIKGVACLLQAKSSSKTAGDVLLTNLPYIDKLTHELPREFQKEFRKKLERELKELY